jgi:murein DD-endopeptidase MepM/ murein hydrolase activator NlpD
MPRCSSILSSVPHTLIQRSAALAALLAAASGTCAAQARPGPSRPDIVALTPAVLVAGSPELIRISAPSSAALTGEWQGKPLAFFRGRDGMSWFALAGVDVEAAAGPSKLTLNEKTGAGESIDLSRDVEIEPAHYATGTLTVEPKFVEPPAEEIARIKSEIELKAKIFSSSADQPLWSGDFRAPVTAPATSSFGMRRTYNGKLASVHKGMDFRAPSGTPIRAGNSGAVVLARPLYYEGNCVVIDHGLGLFTVSMHLSRIDVHEGQRLARGQQIGLSGATGRVTGPHLHWAVRWQDAYLDPAKMLKMDLSAVR